MLSFLIDLVLDAAALRYASNWLVGLLVNFNSDGGIHLVYLFLARCHRVRHERLAQAAQTLRWVLLSATFELVAQVYASVGASLHAQGRSVTEIQLVLALVADINTVIALGDEFPLWLRHVQTAQVPVRRALRQVHLSFGALGKFFRSEAPTHLLLEHLYRKVL